MTQPLVIFPSYYNQSFKQSEVILRGKCLQQLPRKHRSFTHVEPVVIGVGGVGHFPFVLEFGVYEIETCGFIAACKVSSIVKCGVYVF